MNGLREKTRGVIDNRNERLKSQSVAPRIGLRFRPPPVEKSLGGAIGLLFTDPIVSSGDDPGSVILSQMNTDGVQSRRGL